MKIIMFETRRGSEDGFIVRCFEKARCYEVADTLARSFIRRGWAMECNSSVHHANTHESDAI